MCTNELEYTKISIFYQKRGVYELLEILRYGEYLKCVWVGIVERSKKMKNGTFATTHFHIRLSSAWLLATYESY